MKLYMAVTNDKYELPIIVAETVKELADKVGRPKDSVACSITRGNIDKKTNSKYIKILV